MQRTLALLGAAVCGYAVARMVLPRYPTVYLPSVWTEPVVTTGTPPDPSPWHYYPPAFGEGWIS